MPPSEERRVSSAYRVQYVWCVRRGVGVTRPVRVARLGSCFQFTREQQTVLADAKSRWVK